MNATEKRKFIRDLSRSIRDSILAAVPRMPEEWDGHELRELFAQVHERNRTGQMTDRRGRRWREYENERITRSIP